MKNDFIENFLKRHIYEMIISLGILAIVTTSGVIMFMGEGINESYAAPIVDIPTIPSCPSKNYKVTTQTREKKTINMNTGNECNKYCSADYGGICGLSPSGETSYNYKNICTYYTNWKTTSVVKTDKCSLIDTLTKKTTCECIPEENSPITKCGDYGTGALRDKCGNCDDSLGKWNFSNNTCKCNYILTADGECKEEDWTCSSKGYVDNTKICTDKDEVAVHHSISAAGITKTCYECQKWTAVTETCNDKYYTEKQCKDKGGTGGTAAPAPCNNYYKSCNISDTPEPELTSSGTLTISNPSYETAPQIIVSDKPTTSENKEIVAYLVTTSPLMPKANDARWVPWSKDRTDFYLDAGTYYFYVKDGNDNVFELEKLVVNVEANNILSQVQIMLKGEANKTPIYYGKVLGVYGADQKSNYQTYANNSTYGSKLSVDNNGLVMYRLEASEKSTLGISLDKIYVVATKDKATVGRTGTNTFGINANGGITAVSHGVLGSIYEIDPKSANGSVPANNFYAIRLDNIVTTDYADPNGWNNMNLLHYSQYKYTDYSDESTKTSTKISGSTDFSFKVLRIGWNQIAIADNYYNNSTIRLLSASYNEIAANNDGTIYIDTKSNVTQYEATVNASEIAINPILVYTDSTFVEGYGPRTVKLSYGLNVIDIKVRSAKGTVRTYTFLITRPDNRSSDNTLSSLSLSAGNLNPKFNRYTNEYKTSVKNDVTKITVGAKLNNGGAEFISGFGPRTVDLKEGNNTVYVKVKSQTGTQRVYKITIKRASTTSEEKPPVDQTKSSNNYLDSLYLSAGSLTFNKQTTEYNIYVTNDIKSILIKPEVEDSKSTYKVEGPSELAVGSNLYKITVTAENGNTKIYNLNVIRKELGLAVTNIKTLKSLEIAGHKISFDPDNYLYKLTIKPKVKELDIKAIANNERSDIVIEGNMELTSFSDIKVKVIAEDGSYSIYDINITVNRTNILRDALIGFGYVVVLGLIVWAGYKKGKTMRKR